MTETELTVRKLYHTLKPSEQQVAAYFLQHCASIFYTPIATLAKESGASQGAWVRFCKAIGFDGLKSLKKQLFNELNENTGEALPVQNVFTDVTAYHSVSEIIQAIRNDSTKAIDDTADVLHPAIVEQAANAIIQADSVKIFGVGASGIVAEDLYNKLLRVGMNVSFCRDSHIQITYAVNLQKNDAAVFFSNSGTTSEIIECFDLARESKCTTIAVTGYNGNPLAQHVDCYLPAASPEILYRSGAMSSRIAQLTVVDILFTCIAGQNYEQFESCLERSYTSCSRHKLVTYDK